MILYCMSDIHGCLGEFEEDLSLVAERLEEDDVRLILLGDYIHGGMDSRGVFDSIMSLQYRYGQDKVVALMGNHEEFVLLGDSTIDHMVKSYRNVMDERDSDDDEDKYLRWMENLPLYYTEGNTIFVHAGIDEDAGDLWEWVTGDETFTGKYPAQTGQIEGINEKVVAGHVSTAEISGDSHYHDIFYDGASHYYIDGTVLDSGRIPVLKVDTETDKYYRVTEFGDWQILSYEEEN